MHVPPSGPLVPALQVQAVSKMLTAGDIEFDGQNVHSCAPGSGLKVPAEHGKHAGATSDVCRGCQANSAGPEGSDKRTDCKCSAGSSGPDDPGTLRLFQTPRGCKCSRCFHHCLPENVVNQDSPNRHFPRHRRWWNMCRLRTLYIQPLQVQSCISQPRTECKNLHLDRTIWHYKCSLLARHWPVVMLNWTDMAGMGLRWQPVWSNIDLQDSLYTGYSPN